MNEMAKQSPTDIQVGGLRLTRTGIVAGGQITVGEIEAAADLLDHFGGGMNWCIGDLILSGIAVQGEDWALQMVADRIRSVSEATQIQCQWVAQRFPHGKRLNWLSWTHHLAVAGMDCETERTELLESCITPSEDAPGRSEDQPMGVGELRRAVRAARIAADGEEEDDGAKLWESAKRAVLRLSEDQRESIQVWLHNGCPEGGE